jgi:hypothetical protein
MFDRLRNIQTVTFVMLLCMLSLLSCSGGGGNAREGKVDAEEPERMIDEPLKSERITEEEYIASGMGMDNSGLLAHPKMPFDLDTPYKYMLAKDGSPIGNVEFRIEEHPQIGYRVSCRWDMNDEATASYSMVSMTQHVISDDLRPLNYVRRVPLGTGHEIGMKSVDFAAEEFGIKRGGGKEEAGDGFTRLRKPDAELWPYTSNEIFDLALIAACIDPTARNAELWTLDIETERIGRLNLEFMGEEGYVMVRNEMTITARRYEASIDGASAASLIVAPDGKLIAVTLPGNVYAELVVIEAGE